MAFRLVACQLGGPAYLLRYVEYGQYTNGGMNGGASSWCTKKSAVAGTYTVRNWRKELRACAADDKLRRAAFLAPVKISQKWSLKLLQRLET